MLLTRVPGTAGAYPAVVNNQKTAGEDDPGRGRLETTKAPDRRGL